MSKKFTAEELHILSEGYFELYDSETEILATTDGNFFLQKHRQEAVQHAQKEGLELIEIKQLKSTENLFGQLDQSTGATIQEGNLSDAPDEITPEPEVTPEPEITPEPEVTPEPEKAPEAAPAKKKASTKKAK